MIEDYLLKLTDRGYSVMIEFIPEVLEWGVCLYIHGKHVTGEIGEDLEVLLAGFVKASDE